MRDPHPVAELLPFLDPDKLTGEARQRSEKATAELLHSGRLVPLGAMTFDDSRIWGFYVEAHRASYVYVFDFEVSPGQDHITPIGELYRVPLARFTAPPDFEPCNLCHTLFETTAPEAVF